MTTPSASWDGDARALAARLTREMRGQVRFDEGARALYATDASNYRQVPIGVAFPRDRDDVAAALAACREAGAPVLARGGGTSLAGQCCNVAVVLDFTRHWDALLELDVDGRRARVQPGLVLDALRRVSEPLGLTYGPDPSTHGWCTFGGMIGNNACGVHAQVAGRTSDNVESLVVMTSDGEVLELGATTPAERARVVSEGGRRGRLYRDLHAIAERHAARIRERFPDIPRRVSGFNLDELLPEKGFHVARSLVGSEGTCALVLEATVRLVEHWPQRALVLAACEDVARAADHVGVVLRHDPIAVEGLDRSLLDLGHLRHLDARARRVFGSDRRVAWLVVELAGPEETELAARARALQRELEARPRPPRAVRVLTDPREQAIVWEVRESGIGAVTRPPDGADTWPGWEDSAVAPERLGEYLRDLDALTSRHGYRAAIYGHFGQGCVHARLDFDLRTTEGVARYRAYVEEAADLCVRHGGSLSGEHGDGQARGELLERMYGAELVGAFRAFKQAWDPRGLLNPGKVIDARPLDADLVQRQEPAQPLASRWFQFPGDAGSFHRAVTRCVGIGKCRRDEGEVMCPSWRVTHEEEHTTRGRARLLQEMLRGGVPGGWRSRAVREALELCLSCKGCQSDCPAAVDVATYKAEFLAHHYRGRLRPRAAYAMGLVGGWARAASKAPRLANAFLALPGAERLVRMAAGIAPERRVPRLAARPLREAMRARSVPARPTPAGTVLLWPDTFTSSFEPDVALAAIEVLETLGWGVRLPREAPCCGRPLYDFGLLDRAARQLGRLVDALDGELRDGEPLLVLEPSCAAVFRDELIALRPDDARARRLRDAVRTLPELLRESAPSATLSTAGRVLVQAHCHQAATGDVEADLHLLASLGLDVERPEPGCCGMAGAFGFSRGRRHAISVACAERALLPAVRAAGPDVALVAEGFSCREQVDQLSGRRPLHVSQLLRDALRDGTASGAGRTARTPR